MEQTYVERASGKANGIHARVTRARSSKNPTISHEVRRHNRSHGLSAVDKFAPSQILHLQRTLGNRAVGRLVQAKVNISHPDDPYEREADRVADTGKRMTEPAATEKEGPQVQAKPLAERTTPLSQRISEQVPDDEGGGTVAPKPLIQLRRVPVAVREDGEEERVAPKLEPGHELQEDERENAIRGKLATGRPIQRQAMGYDEREEEAFPSATSIQRQLEEEDEETVQARSLSGSLSKTPRMSPICMASSTPSVQLLCADCEDEVAHPKPFDNKLIGSLSLPERAYFESRLGSDFGSVRVHTDSAAEWLATSLDARAFTHGSDIHFGSGQYAPAMGDERRLLAHERAHVVQQQPKLARSPGKCAACAADSVIRRAPVPADFRITGIDPSPDPSKVFFDYTSDAIHATQLPKIKALASPVDRALTLNGYASEEEPAAVPDIIDRRMKAVSKELGTQKHKGKRDLVPNAPRSLGNQDYRAVRMVEVLPSIVAPPPAKGQAPGIKPAPPGLDPCTAPGAENAGCPVEFAPALPVAKAEILDAHTKIKAKTPAAVANMTRFFPGVAVPTIEANVKALKDVVDDTSKHVACHSACDRNCDRAGYWQRPSPAFPIGALIICPEFKTESPDFRIYMILHESAHGTPAIGAEDTAYYFSRQIEALTPAFSAKNTDSYILTIRLTHAANAMTVGPPTPDKFVGMTNPEETMAKRAIAFAESWLNYCSFTSNSLYAAANRALTGRAWPAADNWAPPLIHNLAAAGVFAGDIGDPGAAAPFKLPTRDDMERFAGMRERYAQMFSALDRQVVNVTKGAPGSDSWGGAATGTGIPTLNQTATVGPPFFVPALGDVGRTKYLIRLMGAKLGISAPYQTKYADAADVIRKASKVAP